MKTNYYYRLGANQQKVLLLLLAGVGLGFARTPKQYYKVIQGVSDEWRKINRIALKRAVSSLYKSKLISQKENTDGSVSMVLTENGKKKALTFNLFAMEIKKPKIWDKKWRMVLFDIPEKRKPDREIFRSVLKRLGFYEFQKSVFVHPFECQNELDYIIELYKLRPHIRIATATHLDNELHLKEIFGLL